MTIIFNYLFTQTRDGFITRVPVRIQAGGLLEKGINLDTFNLNGVDLHQWMGKSLDVDIEGGIYSISGLADQ
ncbi:hypothetical protein EXU85_12775 [Spirosoma sp. KCTC 42546]|uniref:hypothetical protein n=1 Tax=Spirosoma sp. KCTC 42546 TaxID=2520506 RepID=UPI00115B4372|nr:hypothetical protein [Spirosoma sp. KCTC 42546]QDK79429.1 hypothetical protein EXU85_12775 [Spirosoma sp. KCTC 42546]